jgi:hypothetical protein
MDTTGAAEAGGAAAAASDAAQRSAAAGGVPAGELPGSVLIYVRASPCVCVYDTRRAGHPTPHVHLPRRHAARTPAHARGHATKHHVRATRAFLPRDITRVRAECAHTQSQLYDEAPGLVLHEVVEVLGVLSHVPPLATLGFDDAQQVCSCGRKWVDGWDLEPCDAGL